MNYQEALAYLYSLSDFERSGHFTRNPEENLPRELRLLEALGNPQLSYTNTLIAGTKGKGSTAASIERVLREAGLRTGLYTQPDLHTFRERIRVKGRLISEDEVAELVPVIRAAAEAIQQRQEFGPFITYEIATALALYYFHRQHVQHAVLEVGLGGRLDATNVTHPLVSVITSISYDHTQILGETLTEIATEKAGIVKPGGVVVTSARPPEALLAIANVCQRQHAHMIRIGAADGDPAQVEVEVGRLPALSYRYQLEERTEEHQCFTVLTPEQTYTSLEIPLAGQHQLENATLALAALEMLRNQGISWDEQALREGLRNVRWPARIDVVEHNPTIVVDGAHNADSMEKLLLALHDSFALHRLIVVLSLTRDKDLVGIARALAGVDVVILTRIVNPRAATIESMQEAFAEHAPHVATYTTQDSRAAMNLALDLAGSSDLICATGSLYLAGEVLRWAARRGDRVAAASIEGVDH
ncbi:MAG TPA: folylpolyglutamate synthase/dihydrofolate synthase family protein [Ktedonobacteraceae bacterium]